MNDDISIHQIIYISSQQICQIFKSVNNFTSVFNSCGIISVLSQFYMN